MGTTRNTMSKNTRIRKIGGRRAPRVKVKRMSSGPKTKRKNGKTTFKRKRNKLKEKLKTSNTRLETWQKMRGGTRKTLKKRVISSRQAAIGSRISMLTFSRISV